MLVSTASHYCMNIQSTPRQASLQATRCTTTRPELCIANSAIYHPLFYGTSHHASHARRQ